MFKLIWKKFKKEIILTGVIIFAFVLLLNRLNQFGFSLMAGAVLMYLYLQYNKQNPAEIKKLKQQLENQQKEIADLKSRKINVIGLKNILEVGLMEIDTNFTRTWNEKYEFEGKDLHFIGALQIQLKAKYGVNLKDLQIKLEHPSKKIYISGLHPKFLSFADINHEWKIAEMMEHKKMPWIISNYWKKSERFQELLNKKMEEKRKGVYDEIKKGPEEIKWMIEPLYQQVENTMRIILNRSDYQINFIDKPLEDFMPLENYILSDEKLMIENKKDS